MGPARRRRRAGGIPDSAPVVPVVVASVAVLLFALPLAALIWRAPWSSAWHELSGAPARDALRLSLITSLSATGIAILLGVPLAWVQARVDYRGKRVVRALTILPMVLPPVVGGVALLLALGRRGIVGGDLERIGIHLPFTTAGAIAAETFVAMPFLVLTLEAAFRSTDRRLEEAARTLGAPRFAVFCRVTMPLVLPSFVAGMVLCWARALGEFGATITFAGNLQGTTQTLPLFVYVKLQGSNPDAAIVLSLVLVGISLAVLIGLRDRWFTLR
ncbi:MAG: ABC transporter permease [Actinomycetota bacterium]|nr:ABC transporter permease [Actinomycetota bacterium]